jgi:hypothetical protein
LCLIKQLNLGVKGLLQLTEYPFELFDLTLNASNRPISRTVYTPESLFIALNLHVHSFGCVIYALGLRGEFPLDFLIELSEPLELFVEHTFYLQSSRLLVVPKVLINKLLGIHHTQDFLEPGVHRFHHLLVRQHAPEHVLDLVLKDGLLCF